MPMRAGYWPVRMLDRVGEQSGLAAYAWVNFTPARGQPVDVRRLVKRAAEAADIPPAEIVGEDEDDVGLLSRTGLTAEYSQRKKQRDTGFHESDPFNSALRQTRCICGSY